MMTLLRRHLLLVVAVVVLAAGGLAFWQADRVRDVDNVGNHAVVDATRTTEVQSAVAAALVRVFSFSYDDPGPTQQAAKELLTGKASDEYALLFTSLEEKAPGQKLVLTAQVQIAAVKELKGDKASLLVFLDQASQRVTDKESTVSAAQLSIDAERVDGTWLITSITPL
ncbi:hypothetical protein ACOACQ_07525 [Nocardioides sp. CPCC 206347]|uniref:hypothetical protein n=1 Tax=unclassified Nocardioides TaxID=2615069 RepID=UPI00361ED2F9